ncbi:MAG: hypothetical protein HXY40_10435 [Chloroflexi bacterium]|nr:hypothetical protein [Chloroflexota bacterium]
MTISDTQMQDLLAALTEALRADDANVDALITQYDAPMREVAPFLALISRLHRSYVRVQPSRRFTRRLRAELLGTPQTDVIARIRYLPARVQIAALVALVAGITMLLTRLRFLLPVPRPQTSDLGLG